MTAVILEDGAARHPSRPPASENPSGVGEARGSPAGLLSSEA